jgi:thioredoxin-dependent peroxiredoxin
MIIAGRKAPSLRLEDADGRKVSLADLSGRWVILYFYPRDDTPGCTTEACDFSSQVDDLAGANAVVVGVSPDDRASHERFIAKHGLRVRLLSDPGRDAMKAYGAWGKKTMYGKTTEGVIRSTVIIDPEGKVAHHWPRVQAKGHAEKVLSKLKELQAARG